MNILLLKPSTLNIVDIPDGQEGFGIQVVDYGFQFRFFQSCNDAEDDFFIITGKGAFALEVRDSRPSRDVMESPIFSYSSLIIQTDLD